MLEACDARTDQDLLSRWAQSAVVVEVCFASDPGADRDAIQRPGPCVSKKQVPSREVKRPAGRLEKRRSWPAPLSTRRLSSKHYG